MFARKPQTFQRRDNSAWATVCCSAVSFCFHSFDRCLTIHSNTKSLTENIVWKSGQSKRDKFFDRNRNHKISGLIFMCFEAYFAFGVGAYKNSHQNGKLRGELFRLRNQCVCHDGYYHESTQFQNTHGYCMRIYRFRNFSDFAISRKRLSAIWSFFSSIFSR